MVFSIYTLILYLFYVFHISSVCSLLFNFDYDVYHPFKVLRFYIVNFIACSNLPNSIFAYIFKKFIVHGMI